MNNKIRLLFYGDAPCVATGFGTVSKNILTGLYNTGKYEIYVLGINYWGDPHPYPFPIWPVGIGSNDPYGRQRCFDKMLRDFNYDVLFLFQDSFILESFMAKGLPVLRQNKNFVTVGYYPVDGKPKKRWIDCMATFDVPVTYTEFAKKESVELSPSLAGKLRVIPHGISTEDFYPLSPQEALSFRSQYFGKHASKFIVTNVNRNQHRKDIPRCMLAFKEFKKRRPNSVLYLHMMARDQGWNLIEVAQEMGLVVGEDVLLPGAGFNANQGFPVEVVNQIYNASDVVVSTTIGEGWGLSSVEAMATKTPVIFPDNTALTEIIGDSRGWLVKSGATLNDHIVLRDDNEVVRPLADLEDLVEKMVIVHDDKEEVEKRVNNAYKWVTSNLVWDKHIVPQWDELITRSVSDWVKHQSFVDTDRVISAEEL